MDAVVTNTNDFMSQDEMKVAFPDLKPGHELVILAEHDGEHTWQRDRDGWHRLQGAQGG